MRNRSFGIAAKAVVASARDRSPEEIGLLGLLIFCVKQSSDTAPAGAAASFGVW
jgi:hypothetical protein